jgi:hypothetical protein
VLGGGSSVLIAITIAMGVGAVGEADRCVNVLHDSAHIMLTKSGVYRSTVLYWLLSMYYLGYVSGTGFSPITMRILWLPFLLAFISWAAALLLTLIMARIKRQEDMHEPNDPEETEQGPQAVARTHVRRIQRFRSAFTKSLAYVQTNGKLAVIVALFPLMATRGPLSELILPYVSNQYGWSLAYVRHFSFE